MGIHFLITFWMNSFHMYIPTRDSNSWIVGKNQPVTTVNNIRKVLLNGSLYFPPFDSEQYQQYVHASIYRCIAKSSVGIIVSPKISIRAVVANDYRAQIYDDYVVEGNTAILECQIPSFVVDYVRVTSWFADDHEIIAHHSFPVGRYSVFPSGHLHIRNITMEDVQIRYRCQTTHILSGKSVISESTGQVYVTARKSSVLPRITHSEIKVTTAGPSVQLPCAAQAQPVPTHSWFKEINGTRKLLVQRPKYQLFGGTLLISSINLSDSGIYVCEVNNSMGSRSTKTELIVTETLGTFMNSTVQMADVGGKTNFTCHTTGGPLQDGIQWYHNGKELDFESGKYSLSGGGEIITIPSVARDDSGMYQCIIRNFKDTAQATGRLELGDVAPMIISGFTRRHLQPGPSINLNCEVSGDPVPDISWYLDGSLISNTERTVIRTRVNTNIEAHSDLTIHKIRSEDGGLYQCIATNKAGQAKHSERINVYGVPSVRQMGNVTVVAGEKFSLRCPVYGYPIHTMVWQKEGKTIFAEGNRRNVTPEGELVVNSADQTLDSGSYTCVASNRQGQRSSQNVWIHVLVKPKLSKIYVSKVIKQGAEVNIFCNIEEGDPPFTFTWFKDGQTVLMQDGLAVQQASSYSILSIRDANQKFNGMYICTARNKAGIAEQNFTVTVQGGPKWVKQITNTSSIEGDTAIFTCQAKGSPQPTITWKRITGIIKVTLKNDDKYEIKDYGELHIKDTQIYDAGQYACEAKNGVLAPITANAFLNVGVPPSILSTNEMRNISVESSITLICDVRGDLPLVIEWRKLADTSYFTNNERFEESQKRQPRRLESSLLIEEIEETDDGTFICEASNNYGQDMISIRLVVQDVPDPPKQLIILSLINGSLEMSWKLPESNGKSEIFYYLLEYKKDGDIWKNASKQKIYANDLNRASISVEDGFSYTLRMFSVNAIGKSDQSTELFFTVIENGTVIVANNIGSDLASSASPSLKALIPWLTTSLAVIISLLGVIVIVFFVVRKKSNPGNRRPSTSQESAKILISTTLRRKQAERDRYGKVLPSMEEDEFKRQELYSNAPKYIYSPSNDFCKPDLEYILFNFPDSEIDISPYATFQLPQAGSIRKSTTELKTFCRFPDVKEREFMTQKTPNNILKNIFPSASNDCNAFTISKLNIVVIVSKLLKFSPSDYHKELYKRFILLNAVNYEYRNICIKLMMAFKLYIYLYPEMVPYYYYSIIIHTHAWEDIWKICPPQWTQDEAKSAIKVYGSSNRLGFLPSADSLLSMISSSSNPSKSINIIDEDLFACIKNGKVVLIIENGLKQPSKMGQISSNMIGCYKCDVTPIIKWLSINGAATQIRSASDNLTLCCASVTELMGIFVNYTSCQPNLACLCARTGLSIYFCGQPMHDFNRGSDVIDAARDVIDAARDVIDAARDVIDAARDVIDAVRDVIPVACLGKLNIAVVVFAFDSDVSTSRLSWQLL
ncbi:Down syndrome cell adhesion molecule-like protein Dscam2 [Nymphon striatum]|nr:Down syndrome cell adhesion molecule-like protein Dscam2 [Nymphon striatum]